MKKIIISKDIKLIQAMKKLALTGLRCLIVVDKKKKTTWHSYRWRY